MKRWAVVLFISGSVPLMSCGDDGPADSSSVGDQWVWHPVLTGSALNAVATNSLGQTAGPFMASTPAAPAGWTAYGYTSAAAGTFTISASGDATTVSLP